LLPICKQKLYGYGREHLIGRVAESLIPARLRDRHRQHREDFFVHPTQAMQVLEIFAMLSNASVIPVDVSLSHLTIVAETFAISAVRNATERVPAEEVKRSEAILCESEERFRLVGDTAPVLIWMSGNDRLCTYFNKPWLEFTGRSLEQELGNGWAEGVHPDDLRRCLDTYKQSFDRREKFRMEYRLRRHDGEYPWILDVGVPRFNEDGSFVGYIGIGVDVTDRKRAEEALQQANRGLEAQAEILQSREELLKIFIKHVPVAVAMLDRDMCYLQASDRWCVDFSLDSLQLLGRSHYEIFPDIPDRWMEIHRRALAGETVRADEDHWDREGGTTWLRWEIRPWQNLDGMPGGVLIFSEDITRRKQIEESLSEIPRKLIEAQEQERSRIGRELHDDIGQRLALLTVELQQLHDNSLILPEVRSRMGELRQEISEIAADIQSLSHELHSAKLQYLGISAAMRGFCRESGEQQNVKIDFQSHDLPGPLTADMSLCFFRVLQEALHNSVKHSGFGTSKCDCGELRMRFISRFGIPALALTAKRQRRAKGSALSAWRNG
jgi:PAS domain S-box-containing protein